MEDAHIVQTDVKPPPDLESQHDAQVFAVFDGHGGAEVSRFCQLYFVDVLTNQNEWSGGNNTNTTGDGDKKCAPDVGKALVGCFHAMDRLIDSEDRRDEINSLQIEKPKSHERRTVEGSGFIATDDHDHNDDNAEEFSDEKKVEEVSTTAAEEEKADDDSNAVVGEIGIDEKIDSDESDGSEADSETEGEGEGDSIDITSEDTVSLFKKLLSVSLDAKKITSGKEEGEEDGSSEENQGVITPTRMLNGRKVCNLPDHPIHAGCTAVCAVIVANTLTVANAGDSRVVLCRGGGVTEAMSFDHKPMHEIEMTRITEAGGFVNQFGRVNGNLNLSRSIGDLKYKQVPGISPARQMITAEPDIKQVELNPDDEFIILACDGIWDCLTNEEAVKYVRDRIDTKTPTEIGIEMLDEIISVDPRATQGIGGDNMTVMIVDLQPGTRSYQKLES